MVNAAKAVIVTGSRDLNFFPLSFWLVSMMTFRVRVVFSGHVATVRVTGSWASTTIPSVNMLY
jgi:hypothetical protein